jgi:hypothetical protein
MGRSASHGEPRRMSGPDAVGPSPFEACSEARCATERAPQGDGDRIARIDGARWVIVVLQIAIANHRHAFASSRRISPEFCFVSPPSSSRGRREGRVLTSHPRSAARIKRKGDRTAAYRWCQSLGLPCAMVGRLMPCSPGSRTFLLASLAPRIDGAVRPVGLAHTSAKA